ncbi:hypothetical protein LCGC14_0170660 [marine sediment metagenome]|jgi:hypothetical protein|uniref:Uncharacterized protein n=1 Tax=marine sediment metagenome TaxID=412755 RepID=A0A0F9V8S6_9ZZZZ
MSNPTPLEALVQKGIGLPCQIKEGDVVFYQPDPGRHGPIKVIKAGQRVVGYATAQDMELEFCSRDLITAERMAAGIASLIKESTDRLYWEEQVVSRITALADMAKLAAQAA